MKPSPLLGTVLPVHGVEIVTLLVGARILPLPTLKFLNVQFRLLLDAWLASAWADDDILAINLLGPRVRPTASKTVRRIITLAGSGAGGSITAVPLESLLGNAGTRRAWGEEELLATHLLGERCREYL